MWFLCSLNLPTWIPRTKMSKDDNVLFRGRLRMLFQRHAQKEEVACSGTTISCQFRCWRGLQALRRVSNGTEVKPLSNNYLSIKNHHRSKNRSKSFNLLKQWNLFKGWVVRECCRVKPGWNHDTRRCNKLQHGCEWLNISEQENRNHDSLHCHMCRAS